MEVIQTIFYILGILYFLAWIVFVGVATYAVWQMYQSVKDAPAEIKAKISEVMSSKKFEYASMAGMFVSSIVLSKIKNKIFGKK